MNGILVFDLSNDLIYKHMNTLFKDKVRQMALAQGLIDADSSADACMNYDVLIQLFSPLIASQRIMLCQFDNSYQSITCEDDLRIVFEEFLGFLFVQFSSAPLETIQHSLGVTISFVKHICGPDVFILKKDNRKRTLLSKLIDGWAKLYTTEQNVMVEAIEQLLVTPDIKKVSISAMQSAVEKLKQEYNLQRCHSLIFVGNKLLALYSTKSAQTLSPSDILFLNIFCQSLQLSVRKNETHMLFLQGSATTQHAGCIPYLASVVALENNMRVVFLVEYAHLPFSNGLYDTVFALQKINNLQMQSDLENLREAYEGLDTHVKQTQDALKKIKFGSNEIDEAVRNFQAKWEILKKKYLDFFKSYDREVVIKIESNMPNFVDAVKELFRLACMDDAKWFTTEKPAVTELAQLIEEKMTEYSEFLKMKSLKNFSMGSYLEEFPGLVHFVHIDRSSGRVIAPNIDLSVESTTKILKNKVWAMVEMSRTFLQRGHMAMMWKDVAFNYSYFLWFEDLNGTSLKPKELPNYASTNVKPQLHAGILAGEYYQRLVEICFPKTASNKIKCYELYCVHLGLVTASCVLEHCRRLAATINDVTGPACNPIDLL